MSAWSSSRGSWSASSIFGVVFIVVMGGFFLIAPYYSTQLWWEIRLAVPFLWWFVAAVLVGFIAMGTESFGLFLIAGALGVAGFGYSFLGNYLQDAEYAQSVRVTSDPFDEMSQRAPYNVAIDQAKGSLGDQAGNLITDNTMYQPDADVYTTPIERRGTFTGYQALLEQHIPLTGRGEAKQCEFKAQADARLDGIFSHSLERAINSEQRWVNWSNSDAYGVCVNENGTLIPHVFVPLKEQNGFFVVTEAPAGVADYNGATGAVTILPDGKNVPGPSYPISLAETQRESTHAMNGFVDYVWERAGWELSDDADATNSSNISEYVLKSTKGGDFYVTPQTPRGTSTNITAVTLISAKMTQQGLSPLVVHRLVKPWSAPNTFVQRIRSDFGDVLARQPGAGVFEVIPVSPTKVAATIGLSQNVLYRVESDGALPIGASNTTPCLLTLDGQVLRCGPAQGGPGVAIGSGGVPTQQLPNGMPAAPVAQAPADSDLSKLTSEQLVDLQKRAADELGRRLQTAGR